MLCILWHPWRIARRRAVMLAPTALGEEHTRWHCLRDRASTTRATSMIRAASVSSPTSGGENRTTSSRAACRSWSISTIAARSEPLVGDGAGCLIQMPDALLRDWVAGHGLTLPELGHYA